jgi:predicted dienelactone hydrolase
MQVRLIRLTPRCRAQGREIAVSVIESALMVTAFVAAAWWAVARRRQPVVLFSPGWGSSREDCTGLCTDLASRG